MQAVLLTTLLGVVGSGTQELLGSRPTEAEAWYLPTADGAGELFVYEIGKGAPVVVLHGGPGGDLQYMLPIADGLTEDYRFVFYDQRGSLRSRATPESITMAAHVADLETLREALGAETIHVVSHSAGTMLAYEYMLEHPDRAGNVVLIGALPHKNGRKYFDEAYAALWAGLDEARMAFNERDAVQAELEKAGLTGTDLTPKEEAQRALIRQVGASMVHVDRWRERLPMRVKPDAARRTRETTNFEYDHGLLLTEHSAPVTVINGELDLVVGPRNSPLWRQLTEEAPWVHLVVIPEAGHDVWFDEPEVFGRALGKALAR